MSGEHPNVALLKRLDIRNLADAADLFAPDFVWHFFNPKLPDMQGDYVGLAGMQKFFQKIGARSGGSFSIEPISVIACGNELVITHTRNTVVLQDQPIATDAVVVWRIVNGRFAEAWDIPSVHTMAA